MQLVPWRNRKRVRKPERRRADKRLSKRAKPKRKQAHLAERPQQPRHRTGKRTPAWPAERHSMRH